MDPGISIFVEEGFADPIPILEATPPPGMGVVAAVTTLIACGDEPPVSVFFFFLGGGALPPLVDLTSIATAGCCSFGGGRDWGGVGGSHVEQSAQRATGKKFWQLSATTCSDDCKVRYIPAETSASSSPPFVTRGFSGCIRCSQAEGTHNH